MTPEALEFVRLTSVQTVKGWEDRAQLQEFRRAPFWSHRTPHDDCHRRGQRWRG